MQETSLTFEKILQAFRMERRARIRHVFRISLAGALIFGVGLSLLDARLEFSPRSLEVLRFVLLVGGFVLLGNLIRLWRGFHFDPELFAVLVQDRLGISRDRLVNGLQLAEGHDSHCSESLRKKAIELGELCAKEVSPRNVPPRKELRKSWWGAFGVFGVCLLVQLLWPGLFGCLVTRLMDPEGLHPSYSRLTVELQVTPHPVYAGSDVTITADVEGGSNIEHAVLWVRPQNRNHELRQVPMTSISASVEKNRFGFRCMLEEVMDPIEVSLNTSEGRSPWQPLSPLPIPRIEEVVVEYRYPAYTGWAPREKILHAVDLDGLAGTVARLHIKASLPLTQGSVVWFDGKEDRDLPFVAVPNAEDPRRVVVEFPMDKSGFYEISLQGEDGSENDQEWVGRVIVREDQPPEITASHDGLDGIVYAGWELPIVGRATDDVRVAEGRILAQVNEMKAYLFPIRDIGIQEEAGLVDIETTLSLNEVGALPGATLQYALEVRDNRPPDGQWSSTAMAKFQVVSQEAYKAFARAQYDAEQVKKEIQSVYEDLVRLKEIRGQVLKGIKDLRERLPVGTRPNPEQMRELAAVRTDLINFVRGVDELQTWIDRRLEFNVLYDFEVPYREWLGEIYEGLSGQDRDAMAMDRAWNPDPSYAPWSTEFDTAVRIFTENTDPFPPDMMDIATEFMEDIQRLEQLAQLMMDLQDLQELIRKQQDLADRMEMSNQAGSADQKERMKGFAKEQSDIRNELGQVMERMKDHASGAEELLPEASAQAMQVAEHINHSGAPTLQREASRFAEGGEFEAAEDRARQAAEALSGVKDACEALGGACASAAGECSMTSGSQAMNSIQQMIDAMGIGSNGNNANGPPGLRIPLGIRRGGAGAGMGGSFSTIPMIGPKFPSSGLSINGFSLPGRSGGDLSGIGTGSSEQDLEEGAGQITPESVWEHREAMTVQPGVPARFQTTIREYFDRLSSDRKLP